jgi:hypothetical protein
VSDLIREGLERLLGLTSDHGAETSKAPEPAPPSPHHDCTERLLARLPMDVRENIVERARVLNLPVSTVVTAMLIVQEPPIQLSPQVSGTARPQSQFLRWQALRQQEQQSADAALSSTAPTPGTSSPPTPGVL